MRMPYFPTAHRHIDRYQEVADDLGEMFGFSGASIWFNLRNWVLGIRHNDGVVDEVESLFAFQTQDPACEGLAVTDGDIQSLREMFLSGPSVSAADVESAEGSKLEEMQADHDEMRDMRRWIGKRLGDTSPYWTPGK